VAQINARTPRYGVTYLETTDNPLDGALAIGAGRSPTVVRPAEGERLQACGAVTAQAYTLIEVHVRATLDGETYEATAGSFQVIPWGLPHEIRNTQIRNTQGAAARLLLLLPLQFLVSLAMNAAEAACYCCAMKGYEPSANVDYYNSMPGQSAVLEVVNLLSETGMSGRGFCGTTA
jgi:hypothetical protein